MILKVQRGTNPDAAALVTDEAGDVAVRMVLPREARAQLGEDLNGYFAATSGADGLRLITRVADPDW